MLRLLSTLVNVLGSKQYVDQLAQEQLWKKNHHHQVGSIPQRSRKRSLVKQCAWTYAPSSIGLRTRVYQSVAETWQNFQNLQPQCIDNKILARMLQKWHKKERKSFYRGEMRNGRHRFEHLLNLSR